MSKSLNKVLILGHLGKDPEIRVTPKGESVANFTVATSLKWKDKSTGEDKEHTEWHKVVAFGPTAEIVRNYLKKGSHVLIEGSLRTRDWQDKNENKRQTTEIVVKEITMLDKKSDSNQESSSASNVSKDDEYSDDIPF